jgi:hypothetical protein
MLAHKWADRIVDLTTQKLRATAYYVKELYALQEKPKTESIKGWSRVIHIRFEHGGTLEVYVDPYQHYLAGIEGSAILNLNELSYGLGSLGLAYSSKNKWVAYKNSPYGRGNRSNPLVPGRDFANSQWRFGTQIIWGPPLFTEGLLKPGENVFKSVMYCGDVFGDPNKPADRVDLFSGKEIDFGQPSIRAEVNKPPTSTGNKPLSTRSTKGAQQSLNVLGLVGLNGKELAEDDDWGKETNFALGTFFGKYSHLFPNGVPLFKRPNDPEIYFQLRKAAHEHGS